MADGLWSSRTQRGAAGLLAALTLFGEAAQAAGAPPYGGGWSAAHADAANSDYAPVEGAKDLTLAWSRRLGGMINLGATTDTAGRVYVTNSGEGCHLHVLAARTGETLWCSDKLDRLAVSSSPLLDDQGRVFIADGRAMHAFSAEGAHLWETPIQGIPLSAQFTPGGRLIFITHIGYAYMLDRGTGEAAMPTLALIPGATFDSSQGARACMRGLPECPSANTPAIDLRRGRIFFTFWAPGAPVSGIRAMQIVEDGEVGLRPLWTNDALPGGSASSPDLSPDGDRLYLTDNDGSLHALDAATGKPIWSYPIGHESGGSPSSSPEGIVMPSGGGRGVLMAIKDEGAKARLLWRNDDQVNRGVPTQAKGGLAYAVIDAGERANDLLVVDTLTGRELDRERLPGQPLFTVGTTLGPDGMVYVPTIRGELHAYRPAAARAP